MQKDADRVEAIIAVGTWIVQNQDPTFARPFVYPLPAATIIKRWVNETDQEVEVWKLDGGSERRDHYTIPLGQTLNEQMWVPWADNPTQYRDHHVVIMVGGQPLAYFWQHGDSVRFNVFDEFVYGGSESLDGNVPVATGP